MSICVFTALSLALLGSALPGALMLPQAFFSTLPFYCYRDKGEVHG